jgi:ComF family protein
LWWEDCQTTTNPYDLENVCQKCGEALKKGQHLCSACRRTSPPYQALRSWAPFSGPLREAIHSLKYHQNMGLGSKLSLHLIAMLDQLHWPIDLVIPVPLSSERFTERGYNQSNLLARPIAFARQIPFAPRSLKRTRNTTSQVGLSAKERLANVHGAFTAQPGDISGNSILLVDDVATTGATLTACTQSLLAAGAAQVYAITLARSNFKNPDLGGADNNLEP